MTEGRRTVVGPDGRAKAYRPLPDAARATAVHDGLEAYARGDFFLAHELLEPAWMGSDDTGERAVCQGLIKLAAAEVHRVRGNPTGVEKNLTGAVRWLRVAQEQGREGPEGLDLDRLIATIDARLGQPAVIATSTEPITLPWSPP